MRKFIKVSLITIICIAAIITGLHIWFVKNANRLLINLVDQSTEGKFKLELSHARFDLFSNEVTIHKAKISSTAKNHNPITYDIGFREVVLHTNSIWSLLFKGSTEIRQLKLYDPVIEVFNRQNDTTRGSKNNLSLGMELGKLYSSIQDAIAALNMHSISIINAKLILNNKTSLKRKPLIFSNIYFSLKKLNKRKNRNGHFLQNNDITFSSSNQDILLTDGIHKLTFKKLVIQHAKSIILDSCTIAALSSHALHNSFNIHFKRLALIDVDFDALYKTNLIKADSVYCEEPSSDFILNSTFGERKNASKEIPDFEKILQEFTGNLDLGFVGVTNAEIHLDITGKKNRTNIHTGKVNFQIKKLRINPDSSQLISLNSFDMLIKGYQLYNSDSSVIYSFDSVRFANDKLLLNDFSVHTAPGINKMRSFRDYSMPYFELLGIDWPELIFRQNLKATEAILHEPTMNYKKATNVAISKKAILFNPHHTFDDFMEIDSLKIVNGQINISWSDNNSLQLQDINLSLLPNDISDYKHVKLQKDVEFLFFRAGFLKLGDITAQLQNVSFNPNNNIHVDEVTINNKQGEIDSKMKDVSIKNIYSTSPRNYVADGLEWEEGTIFVRAIPSSKAGARHNSIQLTNISGKKTQFKFINNNNEGNTFIEEVHIISLEKTNAGRILLKGFTLDGKELNFSSASVRFNAADFFLSDRIQRFSKARFENTGKGSVLDLSLPYMQIVGDINSFFSNGHLDNVTMKAPAIDFHKLKNSPVTRQSNDEIPTIKIDHTVIQEPVVNVSIDQTSESRSFHLPYAKGSELKIEDLELSPEKINIKTLDLTTKKAEIFNGAEKVFIIDDGVDLRLSKINIPANNDSSSWSAMVTKLSMKNDAGFTFNIKGNKLELKDISLGDFILSSGSVTDIAKLLSSNRVSWFSTSSARYSTKNSLLQGFNVSYNIDRNTLMLDSFNYHPLKSRDSAIAANPYQIDYITFNAAKTKLYEFDLVKYLNEDSFVIKKINLTRPSISVYRDKLPPFLAGVRKKLFVEQINNLSLPVSINQIAIDDGQVSYTEKNGKTRREGNLLLTHLNGNIFNISNYNLKPGDSLSVAFTGKLLDAASFDLKIDQSYNDSLGGFVMALKIEPTALSILNPLLTPLSSVKFTSGNLDKFNMKAIGNEDFSYGEMNFYYHGLKILLLKNDDTGKATLLKKIESALVNTFVLKKQNKEGTGLIYFKRLKDRSFFNYMTKIIGSGVTTSVGVKRNSRYRKKILNDRAAK